MLDPTFNAALLCAVAQAYIFAFDLQSAPRDLRANIAVQFKKPPTSWSRSWFLDVRTASALLTGLVVGITVWGRGNSLPVIGLVVLWPALLALRFAWRSRDAEVWINVIMAGIVAGLITIEFYAQYWGPLISYYGVHASYVEEHHWTLKGAMPFIMNVPGFMYWRGEDSVACVGLTFASHLFAVLMLGLALWPRGPFSNHFASRHLIIGGAVIYFGTYLVDMTFFANDQPGFSIYQSLLVWRPMLIGLSLLLVVIVISLFERFGPMIDRLTPVPLAALALGWGVMWTHIYTPWDSARQWPSPRTVERFAVNLDQLADEGKVAVLWYRGWNEAVLNYYRLENDLPPANSFTTDRLSYLPPVTLSTVLHPLEYYHRLMSERKSVKSLRAQHHDNMWSMADYSEENRVRTLEDVEYQFTHASLIVVPEYIDQYMSNEPYAFYKFKNDWAAWLNSDAAPRFRVLMLLQETPEWRLLVLQRENLAHRRGDPFRLPYGNRPNSPPPDYSDAVIRFR
jgi:hypothetical protein